MSGHSKWSSIKRKKAALDAKRGKIFTKIIKEITVAARMGGGDEETNPRLRQAILAAKDANMPADNIKRAIQKGTGDLEGVNYEEATFEGYGPGGVAIMMEVLTDNRKRTVAELRHLLTKYNGNLGESGCVAWMFTKKSLITVDKRGVDEDLLLETILEGGGDDYLEEDDAYEITATPENLLVVRAALEQAGFNVKSAEITMIPQNTVKVEGREGLSLLSLMEALEDHDDIQTVSANFDIEETELEKV
ncbi:MAG: YebC/PmpR family DNA-binding transcriptional regulator [Fidelibacterota bacterium]